MQDKVTIFLKSKGCHSFKRRKLRKQRAATMRQRTQKRVVCLWQSVRAALFLCWLCSLVWTAYGGVVDPFRTLGVSRTASSDEIKKQYRKLCLKYHPDKNVSKSPKEREVCEAKFKQVQEAFDMIENKTFGASAFHPQSGGFRQNAYSQRGSYGNTQEDLFGAMNDLFRSMDAFGGRGGININGMNFEFRRSANYRPGAAFGGAFGSSFPQRTNREDIYPANLPFKSIYKQSVKVPLEDLYTGISSFEFDLKDSLSKRYQASFRGKMILYSLCMALMSSLFGIITRKDKFFVAFLGIMMIHSTTPAPDPYESYIKPIQKGTKGGETSIKFSKANYLEIVFNIQEEKHPLYRRNGNNLEADLVITNKEAQLGCTKRLEALDSSKEDAIEVIIPPKKFRYVSSKEERKHKTKNTVKIRGRGWPIRRTQDSEEYDYGDLVVNVKVQKPPKEKR